MRRHGDTETRRRGDAEIGRQRGGGNKRVNEKRCGECGECGECGKFVWILS